MRPGPGFIALCTILVSACLGFFLLEITAQVTYPIAMQALEEGGKNSTGSPAPSESTALTVLCSVSQRFPKSILQWCELITRYAEKHGLPPDLVAALIWQESGGNPTAYSRSGAMGLMQIMPRDGLAASFMCQNGPCFKNRPKMDELKDPEFNIAYGTKMLSGLVRRNGSLREALKSYGPMNVGYYYADKVLGLFQKYGQEN